MLSCLQADFEFDMDQHERKEREELNDHSEPQHEGISKGRPVTIHTNSYKKDKILQLIIKCFTEFNTVRLNV